MAPTRSTNLDAESVDPTAVAAPAELSVLARIAMSPEEAFVVTRADGTLTVGELVSVTGMSESRAMAIVGSLVTKGALRISGGTGPVDIDPVALNEEGVDLDRARRKEILTLFARLDRLSHYRLLELDPLATSEEVRSAYLSRCKQFHPDAFFGRRLGSYAARVDAIFHRLRLAHDVLIDDTARRRYDADPRAPFTTEERGRLLHVERRREAEEKRTAERRQRLRRAPGMKRLSLARKQLADGDALLEKGDLPGAAEQYRKATMLDPNLAEAKTKLEKATRMAALQRAESSQKEAARAEKDGDLERAYKLLRGAVAVELSGGAAHLALAKFLLRHRRDLEEAHKLVRRAVERGEKSVELRLVLGEILIELGHLARARRELEAAAADGAGERATRLLQRCGSSSWWKR